MYSMIWRYLIPIFLTYFGFHFIRLLPKGHKKTAQKCHALQEAWLCVCVDVRIESKEVIIVDAFDVCKESRQSANGFRFPAHIYKSSAYQPANTVDSLNKEKDKQTKKKCERRRRTKKYTDVDRSQLAFQTSIYKWTNVVQSFNEWFWWSNLIFSKKIVTNWLIFDHSVCTSFNWNLI